MSLSDADDYIRCVVSGDSQHTLSVFTYSSLHLTLGYDHSKLAWPR